MTAPGASLFRRVLVANRGEIAVRIIRACRELGIGSVAVFSDADVVSLHVRLADEAVRIGPAAPSDSYLRGHAIIEAARQTHCDAIHPGYGFLAERADFAEAVVAAGLTFVGPPPAVLDTLGNKLHARRIASEAGVPVVPGTLEPARLESPGALDEMVRAAERVGFPLLVKAAAGGGGRGMRRVDRAEDVADALRAASAEAASAFGDGAVYLERQILRARHVEVQLLGDRSGRIVAVGERDCSIQRRHQKLVEEAPAPGLSTEARRTLHQLAVRIGLAAGLQNAATVEFLLTPEGKFHFLEVNTRLQVEHGITELVSGLDLVHEQIRLAAGWPISPAVEAAAGRAADPGRHAIEVRLTAEDPGQAFAPTPGVVRHWRPPSGPGVRVDSAVEQDEQIPPEYDNLIAKLMVVAGDRPAAIRRLSRALDETEVGGVQTTLPFHRHVAASASFAEGRLSTDWIDEHWDGASSWEQAVQRAQLAAALLANGVDHGPSLGSSPGAAAASTGPEVPSPWRLTGRRGALRTRVR